MTPWSATKAWVSTSIQGTARIVSPWEVEITDHDGRVQRLTTRSIVIAAGARPFVPPIPGIGQVGF